jgi:hypothetical protein
MIDTAPAVDPAHEACSRQKLFLSKVLAAAGSALRVAS